jgi:putative ABC transport system permease protein
MPMGRFAAANGRFDARAVAPIGRLREGVSPAQAAAEARTIADRTATAHPETSRGWTASAVSLPRESFEQTGSFFGVLQGAVMIVMILVCANVGTLLLARGEQRRRELAIRSAIGATRGRLMSQLLLEPVLLAATGGALALAVTPWAVAAAPRLIPEQIPYFLHFRVDWRVVTFTVGVSGLTAVLAGMASAVRASRVDLAARMSASPRPTRLRSALVLLQGTAATLLVCVALTLAGGFVKLQRTDFGFDPRNTVTFEAPMSQPAYAEAARQRGYSARLLDEVAATPGIVAVGGTARAAIARSGDAVVVERASRPITIPEPPENFQCVTADYFRAMGMRLVRGRAFERRDSSGAPVAIVNEEAARRFWPGEDPIGKRARFGRTPETRAWRTVVGVVANTTLMPLDPEVEARIYAPFDQEAARPLSVTVRTAGPPAAAIQAIATAARRADWNEAIDDPEPGETRVARGIWPVRFYSLFLGSFSVFALALAALGVFGVTQYSLNGRRREIAIRRALGAPSAHVGQVVARAGIVPAGVGAAIGLAAAIAITVGMNGFLPGVEAFDPFAVGLTVTATLVASVLATVVPAARAIRVNPAEGLRND